MTALGLDYDVRRRHSDIMRGLLLRHRAFSLLWVAGLISMTGDWLLMIALPIYVFKLTGSPAATSAVVAASVAAALLFGVIAGVFVDRWDRRRTLVVANILQVAAIAPLLLVDSGSRVWIVLMVAFVESGLSQFVAPAEHALLPRLVAEDQLGVANSLNTLNSNIARLGGPALGAIVAVTLGLSGATLLDAASFAVAAALIAAIGGSHRAETVAAHDPRQPLPAADQVSALARLWFDLAQGLSTIGRSRVLRAVLLVATITAVGEGIMGSLFVVFAARGISGGSSNIGWLMSAQAVGGIIGGLLAATVARRLPPIPTVITTTVLFGLIDVVIFNTPRVTSALAPQLVLFVLVGIPGAIGLAAMMTLLQTSVGDALRGRVFAAVTVAEAGAALVGTALAANLADRFGVFTVLTAQGLGYVVAGLAFAIAVRPSRRRAAVVRMPIGGVAADPSVALQRRCRV
jgi:MFS family permease